MIVGGVLSFSDLVHRFMFRPSHSQQPGALSSSHELWWIGKEFYIFSGLVWYWNPPRWLKMGLNDLFSTDWRPLLLLSLSCFNSICHFPTIKNFLKPTLLVKHLRDRWRWAGSIFRARCYLQCKNKTIKIYTLFWFGGLACWNFWCCWKTLWRQFPNGGCDSMLSKVVIGGCEYVRQYVKQWW